jgi:hypothetical protein
VPRGMRAASCHSGPFPLACGPSPLWNGKRAPPSGEPCWYRPHGTRNLRAGALCLADYPVPASPPNHRRGEPACVGGPENLPHRSASRPAAWPGCYLTGYSHTRGAVHKHNVCEIARHARMRRLSPPWACRETCPDSPEPVATAVAIPVSESVRLCPLAGWRARRTTPRKWPGSRGNHRGLAGDPGGIRTRGLNLERDMTCPVVMGT